jgi:putative membrane protein
MDSAYWNDWYAGWGWFLWFGVVLLLFSNVGNWGYTYQAHRLYRTRGSSEAGNRALNILNENYARGDMTREEFLRIRSDLKDEARIPSAAVGKGNLDPSRRAASV